MKLIDLAVPFQNGTHDEKGFQTSNLQRSINYHGHEVNAMTINAFLA